MNRELVEKSYEFSSQTEEFLRKIDIFKKLPKESLESIDKRIKKDVYQKGQKIMSEFDVAKGVFFVHSGVVKLTKQEEQGNELIVCIKKKGDIFAEACLFNYGETTYPASATMIQEGEVYFLSRMALEQVLISAPEMAMQLIRYMGESLQDMTSIMRDIALLDVYTKTMKQIARLAEKFGANHCNRVHIELPITISEFSTLTGASRESVSRVFSRLKKEGLIQVRGKQIVITDWCKFCSHYDNKRIV